MLLIFTFFGEQFVSFDNDVPAYEERLEQELLQDFLCDTEEDSTTGEATNDEEIPHKS